MRKNFVLILFLATILSLFLFNQEVRSIVETSVFGWAWSENIGWISFNCNNPQLEVPRCLNDYALNIDSSGKLSGYAWSENIGWISFNEADTGSPPSDDPCAPGCIAVVTPSGQFGKENVYIEGWAKALAHDDGWIRFDHGQTGEAYIDSDGDFHGWAWGSDVVGWVSFNSSDPGAGGASYKVTLDFSGFNSAPVASMSCDISGCSGGACNGSWIAYRPTADPTPCVYKVNNDSTDDDGQEDIVKTEWYLDEVLKSSCSGICDYTLQDMSADDYVIKLYVEDSEGESDFTTHSFAMREEVRAGFMCSLDNENWESCETISVAEDEILYLKDHASLPEHSTYSEGASGFWTRIWEKGDGETFEQFGPIPGPNNLSTTLSTDRKVIRLTVADNQGRLDYQDHNLSVTLPLPEWQEVAPF